MSAIKPILNIIDKITNLINFDRKSRRRIKIKRLEAEINEILRKPYDKRVAYRLANLRRRLRMARDAAVAD